MMRVPVSPENVTVLGYRVKATNPMWSGLDMAKAEPRTQTTIELACFGSVAAPLDIHLRVPWRDPDDRSCEESDCWYRVRPRMEVGKKWKGKVVKSVAFERWNGEWFLAIET